MVASRPVRRILFGLAVRGDHPSRPAVTRRLERPTRGSTDGPPSPCLALLPVGFAEPPGSPRALVRSYRTVSPLPVRRSETGAIGGLFSVALSCGSPRLGVTQHRALWSPDVPRTGHRSPARGRPADSLPATRLRASRSAETASRDRRSSPARATATGAEPAAEHAERGGDHEVAEDLARAQHRASGRVKRPLSSSRTQPDDDPDRDPEHERADARRAVPLVSAPSGTPRPATTSRRARTRTRTPTKSG